MKKKVLALSIVMVLLAIAVVGGSLAWFTDTDYNTNTFTVGSVKIRQDEEFDTDKASNLMPVFGTFDEEKYAQDNYIKKKVTVLNTGKNDAFVQTFVAMPKDLVDNEVLGFIYNEDTAAGTWTRMDDTAIIGEVEHAVYRFRYKEALEPGERTPTSLEYMYIYSDVNANTYDLIGDDSTTDTIYLVKGTDEIDTVNIINGLHVYVASQAVQAEGFNVEEGELADAALDAAFGKDTIPEKWWW